MAKVSLGTVGIVDKGNYSATTTYAKGNFVFYLGSTWLCLKDNTKGVTPTNDGTNWKYLARGYEETDSIIIEDDVTGKKYKFGISDGSLFIEESSVGNAEVPILTDIVTNKKYRLGITEANIFVQET